MNVLVCLLLVVAVVYSAPQYGEQPYGQISYKLKYDIDLPKDKHNAHAQWQVEDDAKDAHYNLRQSHPYGAKSNIYHGQQSHH